MNRAPRFAPWRRAALALGLLLAVGVGPGRYDGPPAHAHPSRPDAPFAELLVRWRDDTPPPAADGPAWLAELVSVGRLTHLAVERYAVAPARSPSLLAALRADSRVEYAEPNARWRMLSSPNDPQFGQQWNMRQIRAPAAWDVGTGAGDVIVAILDSGIDATHPELAGRVVPGRNVRERNGETRDDIGHGTHVAGIIGALGNNGAGVAGLSWGVRLMPIKITDRHGDASIVAAADGIRWAAEHGARIVNLSLGGLDDSQTVRRAVADARNRGVLLIAAAGNCGELISYREEGCDSLNAPFYPAALDEVIAVGALGANDELAPYSNTGEYVRLSAPGGTGSSARYNPRDYVLSTWPANLGSAIDLPGYSYEVGTSMAAPHVSGTAALIWSTNPTLSRDQVEAILFETAEDLGPPGRDDRYGYGRVDAQRAVERAASLPGSRASHIQILLEAPALDSVVVGALTVNGWAVDSQAEGSTGIDAVEAYLDGPPGEGRALGPPRYGVARPDVARVLDRRGFANAGFSLTADVSHGVHTLWVRAHSSLSGAWGLQQTRFIVGALPRVSIPSPGAPSR